MVNQEHLNKLKEGVPMWNQWRDEHPDIQPVLSNAILSNANLSGADLSGAILSSANLNNATLIYATLSAANLSSANLNGANLSNANLSNAILSNAILSYTYLSNTNLCGVTVRQTTFGNVDLSMAKGLETVRHDGPSTIGIDTIISSQGKILDIFLRKAGVPDFIIEAIPSLIGSLRPIDYYTCFISYSSTDQAFAERLYADLQSKGVRCWFAPEDLKIGEEFPNRIEEAIRLYDKLLVILSKHSVKSSWVEDEVRAALEKEAQFKREQHPKTVLFPIKIDDAIEQEQAQWVAMMRRKRHIGDCTQWKNHDDYQKAFSRLLHDLKAEAWR